MQAAFYPSEFDHPHPGRARAILKAHPEIRELMVRNPWTALIAASIVVCRRPSLWNGTSGISLLVAESFNRLLCWGLRQSCELRHHS